MFDDGGYYLDNGVSLCSDCHIEVEKTTLSCDTLRELAKIDTIILPKHLYSDNVYDKWGNIILSNGTRLKGELFFDESVQKILGQGNVLSLFSKYIKYPRTYHLPYSQSRTKDDRTLDNTEIFKDKEVVVTIKMDGENSTIYNDYYHARSLESDNHESRTWLKNYIQNFQYDIPNEWRICGENLFAKHAIHYNNLKSYFYCFSIWNEKNECLSWDDTLEWCDLLNIETVPVLYRGIYNEELIKSLWKPFDDDKNEMEGFVVRLTDSFSYGSFRHSVAKFVRKNHIMNTVHNWKHTKIIKNNLINEYS